MAIDQSQLDDGAQRDRGTRARAAVGRPRAVAGGARPRRRRARIELALPVAAWPGSDELADEVHRVARTVPGVEEIEFDLTVMHDDERAALRVTLRRDMFGVTEADEPEDGSSAGGDADGHGHGHGARGTDARVLAARLDHARHRRVVGEGRRRQVDGDGEPGRGAGPGGPQRRSARRRRLRLLGAQDARDRPRPDHPRRRGDPHLGPRGPVPVHGVLRARTTSRSSGGARCCTRPFSSS